MSQLIPRPRLSSSWQNLPPPSDSLEHSFLYPLTKLPHGLHCSPHAVVTTTGSMVVAWLLPLTLKVCKRRRRRFRNLNHVIRPLGEGVLKSQAEGIPVRFQTQQPLVPSSSSSASLITEYTRIRQLPKVISGPRNLLQGILSSAMSLNTFCDQIEGRSISSLVTSCRDKSPSYG